jgi:hypothetical protein
MLPNPRASRRCRAVQHACRRTAGERIDTDRATPQPCSRVALIWYRGRSPRSHRRSQRGYHGLKPERAFFPANTLCTASVTRRRQRDPRRECRAAGKAARATDRADAKRSRCLVIHAEIQLDILDQPRSASEKRSVIWPVTGASHSASIQAFIVVLSRYDRATNSRIPS